MFNMGLLYYQNVNRFRTKLTEFYLNILNCNYDVICLTETNLNESIYDAEILDSRYNIFRRDRYSSSVSKTEGGGVLVATNKNLNVFRQASWESKVEDVWISILPNSKNKTKINICVCYLPNHLSIDEITKCYDNCQNIILNSGPDNEFFLIGDFNTPNINWSLPNSDSLISPLNPSDRRANLLINFITLCNLVNYNNVPNHNNRYLDLALSTSTSTKVHKAIHLSRLDNLHPALEIILQESMSHKPLQYNVHKRYNFGQCDYDKIRSELRQVDWSSLLNDPNVDIYVSAFYNVINGLIQRHTPLLRASNQKYPPWYSPALIKCLAEKAKYHKNSKNLATHVIMILFPYYVPGVRVL